MRALPSVLESSGATAASVQAPAQESGDSAVTAHELHYRLVSINAVSAPAGCTGRDWFVYRIVQGDNAITGYRRGSLDTVGAQVDTIVSALNERRAWPKTKVESTKDRRAEAAKARAAAAANRKAAEAIER